MEDTSISIEKETHVGNLFGWYGEALSAEMTAAQTALEPIIVNILEQARRHMDADGCVVEMVDGDELVYCAVHNMSVKNIGVRINKHKSLSGMCAKLNEVLICEDTTKDARVDADICARANIGAMIVAPILRITSTGYELIGVLKAFYYNARVIRPVQASILVGSAQALSSTINTIKIFK